MLVAKFKKSIGVLVFCNAYPLLRAFLRFLLWAWGKQQVAWVLMPTVPDVSNKALETLSHPGTQVPWLFGKPQNGGGESAWKGGEKEKHHKQSSWLFLPAKDRPC
ncbi:hypothetical protein CEXT_680691 [Caerostris extrusa]|uniref:CRAL-TRIO domain-containing protein n=1 Tax=Caerostris extrusa TaxID=172846 RepID=A0AAV4W1Q7_CAEEX|nr:hypothetical protein CEXT_680691 [Caerostris extrusa]